MSARAKIENLTNAWYGFDLFSGGIAIVGSLLGFSFFSAFWSALWMGLMLGLTFFLGRKLLNRSALWRLVLMGVSALLTFVGTITVLYHAVSLLSSFSFATLFYGAMAAVGVSMQVRSFRTLADSQVKAYIG